VLFRASLASARYRPVRTSSPGRNSIHLAGTLRTLKSVSLGGWPRRRSLAQKRDDNRRASVRALAAAARLGVRARGCGAPAEDQALGPQDVIQRPSECASTGSRRLLSGTVCANAASRGAKARPTGSSTDAAESAAARCGRGQFAAYVTQARRCGRPAPRRLWRPLLNDGLAGPDQSAPSAGAFLSAVCLRYDHQDRGEPSG
jgi:hypothetical protein